MKTLALLLVSVCFLTFGCATSRNGTQNYLPPQAISSPTANLLIVSAVYGSGIHFADVTYRVNDLLHQRGVEFFARPEWLHADPTPGWNKALVIVYEFKGHRRIFTTGEGGKVNVELLLKRPKK
jgi:hypothetical protein